MSVVVLVGGLEGGFEAFGPFPNRRAAIMWVELDSPYELAAAQILNMSLVEGYCEISSEPPVIRISRTEQLRRLEVGESIFFAGAKHNHFSGTLSRLAPMKFTRNEDEVDGVPGMRIGRTA